ncbi:MAG: virulence-associated E family protein [Iphinoe sp. HA4291-MV1]|jgi:predicted P-loop ATPase|nr:virulence-associated E family protein [Iphinoe sp. HA4291-MV1]
MVNSIITNSDGFANVRAFTVCYNKKLNVLELGHKPTDKETGIAQKNFQQNLGFQQFQNHKEFAEFLAEGHTIYSGVFRKDAKSSSKSNIEFSQLLFFDYDDINPETLKLNRFVQTFGGIIQPSYSADPEAPRKWHLLIQTDRQMSPDEYLPVWKACSQEIGLPIDQSKKGANNLCFGSRHTPIIFGGKLLPADEFLDKYNQSIVPQPKTFSNQCLSKPSKPSKIANLEDYRQQKSEDAAETITLQVSRYVRTEIVDKILAGDITRLYCLYLHDWKNPEFPQDGSDTIQKVKGRNPYSPTNSTGTSFVISLKDNGLAPVFYDGSGNFKEQGLDKNGGSIFRYWYDQRKDAPWAGKSLKDAFIEVVHDLCDHFGAPRFDFRTVSKAKQRVEAFRKLWGDKLRYNLMTLQPELDGVEVDFDTITVMIADKFGIGMSKEEAIELFLYFAKQRNYHPVQDYLEAVESNTDIKPICLDRLATRYLGTDSPLHNKMLKKTLVAAVARVFSPGCQVDTVCVLQGVQGLKKSTFWKTLAGDWFDDGVSAANEKDDAMKLKRYWIIEFPEIENIFKKKEISGMRIFITRKSDNFRPPYARSPQEFPRTSILVGSVNPKQFLQDTEGNRRYWVIPVSQKIDLLQLQKERDGIFKAAVAEFRSHVEFLKTNENPDLSPFKWWFDEEDEQLNNENNEEHMNIDFIEEIMLPKIANIAYLQTTHILELLHVPETDKHYQMRVVDILKKYKWEYKQKRIDGKKARYWFNPDPSITGTIEDLKNDLRNPVALSLVK